jgi:hypothetical protein
MKNMLVIIFVFFIFSCSKNNVVENNKNDNAIMEENVEYSTSIKQNKIINITEFENIEIFGNIDDIDGYYINRNFIIWKIYTKNNITYMENLCHSGRYTEEIFQVTEKIMEENVLILALDGKPKIGNPNQGQTLHCIIYKIDDKTYLDEGQKTDLEMKNGSYVWGEELKILNEFIKEDIEYDADMFEKYQDIYIFYRGSYYYKNNIYVITPKYPVMEIALIELDDNFIVKRVDVGSIKYENNEMFAFFSDRILSFENDLEEIRNIKLYERYGKTKDIIFPNIGDRIIMSKQYFDKINIK